MNRKFIIAIFISLLVGVASSAADTRVPVISLKQALAAAEKYVEENKLDVSSLSLVSIYRSEYPKNPKQNNWTVVWAPEHTEIVDGELWVIVDGELRVYIYDDGRIEHGGSA